MDPCFLAWYCHRFARNARPMKAQLRVIKKDFYAALRINLQVKPMNILNYEMLSLVNVFQIFSLYQYC